MDARKLIQRQIDEERTANQGDAVRLTVREMLKMVHTGMPGRVTSFNATTQTATVQPSIKRIWVDDGSIALPPCPDVPVHFPGGGGYVLTFPVAAGDDCLLVFAERAIDFWFEKGGTQDPSEYRMHDLSDGFAFVGFRPKPNAVGSFATNACELRRLDGTAVVRVEASMVTLGSVAGSQPAVLGTALMAYLTTLAAAVPAAAPTTAILATKVKVS